MNIQFWVGIAIAVLIVVVGTVIPLIIRRQYREILKALGNNDNGSIMNALGVDKDRPSISAQLGTQIGDTSNHGNLTAQHKTIENKVDNINDRAEAADRRNAILSGDLKTIADAVEALNAFKDKMERLYSENIDLRLELDKAGEKTAELSKDRIPFDSGLASAKQDEHEKEPGRFPRNILDDEETEM